MTEENQTQEPQPQRDPSVWDYFLAKLMPWRGPAPEIPPLPEADQAAFTARVFADSEDNLLDAEYEDDPVEIPWRALGIIAFALAGQFALMPPGRHALLGVGFFLAAIGLSVWAVLEQRLTLAQPEEHLIVEDDFDLPLTPLLAGLGLSLIAFLLFGGNRYTDFNLLFWFSGLGVIVWSFLKPRPDFTGWFKRVVQYIRQDIWDVKVTRHIMLFVLVLALGVFFRASHVGEVVSEMFSDQAEKLLDVYDLMQGQHKIFFERNTGREGLQFYLIAAAANLFDTGISFLSMKIGTIFLGIAMLPYVYLLGKELGNKWVGLAAMFLAGIAFWPNILARVALRFMLYPAFAAPALYYLVRGLRTGRRNFFVAAAIFLGIGLHGYTPFRAVPILFVVVFALYWLHNRSRDNFYKTIIWLSLVVLISLIVFLPLLRVWFEMPERFNYRTATRLTNIEKGEDMVQGLGLLWVFAKNVWNGLLMFNWDSGDIWVNTIPGYPSLDIVTGAFFVLGVGLVLLRYLREKRWEDAFLLLAVPILMLPSTLVLAYPEENPAPNRAGGAAVVVFIIAAFAFEALLRAIRTGVKGKTGQRVMVGFCLALALFAAGHNYTMTFENYATRYEMSAWNTSELGAVIEQFTDTVGSPDQAWVVAYPHWVDTRLVGMNAGFPIKDFAIDAEALGNTLDVPSPKLFLIKLEDEAALGILSELYPEGEASLYTSSVPTHSFHVYYVP